jgi:hypothetical protein
VSEPLHFTDRDRELLQALSQKVRLFSQRQVAEHLWNGELANARRRLKRLEQAGLVTRLTVHARSLPPIETPLLSWRPHEVAPDFGALAYRCQHRWKSRAVRSTTAWIVTEAGARAFGGVGRGELTRATQVTHDLGVAAVWLRLRQVAPQWATAWRGEDVMAHTRLGEKLPDGFIVDEQGQIAWIIEFAGAYDTDRIRTVHQDCVERELPYQLW